MSNPAIRSEGGVRRFVVHAAHETRDRGKVVRATGFEAAALAFAEAWRPVPDADGSVHLVLTDLDSGERQEAAIDVARPGVADLQLRRARLEARAAVRPETPPGAERFAIGPITTAEPPMAQPKTADLRRWAVNAAAALAVLVVAAILVTQLIRDQTSEAPWAEAAAPGPAAPLTEAPRLRAAVLQPAPAVAPAPAPPATAGSAPGVRTAAARPPLRRAPAAAPAADDGVLTLPAPDVAPQPLELPGAEPAPEAEPEPEAAAPEAPPEAVEPPELP